MSYVVPSLILLTFLAAVIKRVPLFPSFLEGVQEALKLVLSTFPYLLAIFLAIELFRVSGLSKLLAEAVSPAMQLLGVPPEVTELLVLKPVSGSGSLVALRNIYDLYGADSYIGRVASVISGASDTVLYIAAVYFSTSKDKKTGLAIPISIFTVLIGAVLSALFCRIL